MKTDEPVGLWIEELPYKTRYGSHYLLHHNRDCSVPPCTFAIGGIIRFSEDSRPYAVHSDHLRTMMGDVCQKCLPNPATDDISDGYHTFGELYEHRSVLFIALMNTYSDRAWFASQHEDGSMFPGYFIAGMELPTGNITYHLRESWLELARSSGARELPTAPPYDGHTPADVINRLKDWINYA